MEMHNKRTEGHNYFADERFNRSLTQDEKTEEKSKGVIKDTGGRKEEGQFTLTHPEVAVPRSKGGHYPGKKRLPVKGI